MRPYDNLGWEKSEEGLQTPSPHSRQTQTRVFTRVLVVSKDADCTALSVALYSFTVCPLPAILLQHISGRSLGSVF